MLAMIAKSPTSAETPTSVPSRRSAAVRAWPSGRTSRHVRVAASPLPAHRAAGSVLAYGSFITVVINFIILAFCIFLVVRLFNAARRRFEPPVVILPPPGPSKEELLLTEIRDLLARAGGQGRG